MYIVYLDYNCFQRGFDDSSQIKIKLEGIACEEIFSEAEMRKIALVWSFMHEDENMYCPFIERKQEVLRLSKLCTIRIGPKTAVHTMAEEFQKKANVSAKDAIHVACAFHAKSAYFLTCDDELIKRARRLKLEMNILNPVEYIRGEIKQ